jgi:LPXTG-motif cell wall-anchored protein
MMRVIVPIMLLLLIVGFGYVPVAFAASSIQQTTTTPGCPTYQVNILVDVVDSNPINVVAGDIVVTRVHVVYPDGTPVTLSPETMSFLFNGSKGHMEFDNVQVVYTGTPGFYNYTQTITADLIQATGQGKVTIFVVTCSCSDGGGNRGPPSLISSDLTLTPSDNSNLNVGITPPPTSQVPTYIIAAIIILLLLIALLLFLRRRRKKK